MRLRGFVEYQMYSVPKALGCRPISPTAQRIHWIPTTRAPPATPRAAKSFMKRGFFHTGKSPAPRIAVVPAELRARLRVILLYPRSTLRSMPNAVSVRLSPVGGSVFCMAAKIFPPLKLEALVLRQLRYFRGYEQPSCAVARNTQSTRSKAAQGTISRTAHFRDGLYRKIYVDTYAVVSVYFTDRP